jgi:hypothetical protein
MKAIRENFRSTGTEMLCYLSRRGGQSYLKRGNTPSNVPSVRVKRNPMFNFLIWNWIIFIKMEFKKEKPYI